MTKGMCQSWQQTPHSDSVLSTWKPFRTPEVLHMNIRLESMVRGVAPS